jgi:hypothetical protein
MKTFFTIIIGVGLICSSHAAQTNEPPTVTSSFFTRVLRLDSSDLSRMRLQVPPENGETSQDYILRYFKTQHIEFQSPAYLKFDEARGKLMIKTTEVDFDKIERLVSKPQGQK